MKRGIIPYYEQLGYTAIPIRIADQTSHILITLEVNGTKARFILDTGASASCIDSILLEKYSLTDQPLNNEIKTASGVLKPGLSTGNILSRNEWRATNVNFLTMDMTHINAALKSQGMRSVQGLLGADFFIRHKAIISYKSKKLLLLQEE